jgi:hypothetical protein
LNSFNDRALSSFRGEMLVATESANGGASRCVSEFSNDATVMRTTTIDTAKLAIGLTEGAANSYMPGKQYWTLQSLEGSF